MANDIRGFEMCLWRVISLDL